MLFFGSRSRSRLDPSTFPAGKKETLILHRIGGTPEMSTWRASRACLRQPTSLTLVFGIICVMVSDSRVAQAGVSPDVRVMAIQRSTFKAAVYAHAVFIPIEPYVVSRDKAVQNMEVNLGIYRTQSRLARQQNAEIIVFPEDGIYGMTFSRDTIYPYLEEIPDPATEAWTPCTDPHRHKDSDVQVALSCIAQQNQMYVVANMGDKKPCEPSLDPKCPGDRRYQFNTDVAYGPGGEFLARYHKYNLYYEWQFDTPPTPEHIFFDTHFGRVGLATCFDVLFREPIIPLVEVFNVTVIAFPTAWMDALPLLPAIGFHSSFARAHSINFLSANIHLPEFKFDGSGLYASDGAHAFYYGSGAGGLSPKLLIAEMNVVEFHPAASSISYNQLYGFGQVSGNLIDKHDTELKRKKTLSSTRLYSSSDSNSTFESVLFSDVYTFKALTKPSGKLQVCQGKVCCYLEYQVATDEARKAELYAFGAFDGLHTHDGNYYMQNCILVKCADAQNKKSCGSLTFKTSTRFTRISLRGQFETHYVYPQVILSDYKGHLALTPPAAWSFNGSALETNASFSATVLNAVLLGRDYSRDNQGS